MEVHSLFIIQLVMLSFLAIGALPDGDKKRNLTLPEMPATHATSDEHNLAEPAKPNVASNNSSLTTPSAAAITSNTSSFAPNVTQAESKEKPAPAKHPERKVMGREGVVDEHQPKEKPLESTNSTTANSTKSVSTAATPVPQNKGNSSLPVNSGSANTTSSSKQPITSTTPTTSSTTTTTTTTTTTPKPKKPTVTFSIEDEPSIINATRGKIHDRNQSSGRLSVEIPDTPVAQPSMDAVVPPIHRDYFISVVAVIFAVPIIMGAAIVMVRRFKDYWSTRHYRRMDFLVDGMYND